MSVTTLSRMLATSPPDASAARSPVHAVLNAVREHLGMEIAFASRLTDTTREFTHISADIPLPLGEGDAEPLEQTFCHHILQGRLPELIHDANDYPLAATLPITGALPVGAHITVPLRFSDGRIYGTFCCLSRTADRSLTDRDLSTLRAFADLASAQIERDQATASRASTVVAQITSSIAAGLPTIVLQPIHSLVDGRSVGAEALARFPDHAARPPSDWFAEAFEVDLGVELELAAIGHAFAARHYLPVDHYLSVNVSPETLLSGRLDDMLASHAVPNLVLELTEHARVDDYAALGAALAKVRRHARIAIDDVGAGYSSLRHIIALEPDILKLDMSLTRNVDLDPARRALAVALVTFADSLHATIVAEGIETDAEATTLRGLGIRHGQGYLYARPMPPVAAQQHVLECRDAPPAASPVRMPSALRRSA